MSLTQAQIDEFVDVESGELLTGHYFPTVWDHGPIDPPAQWSEEQA